MYKWSKAKDSLQKGNLENIMKRAVTLREVYRTQQPHFLSWHPETGLHPLRKGLARERQDPGGDFGEFKDSRDERKS